MTREPCRCLAGMQMKVGAYSTYSCDEHWALFKKGVINEQEASQ